MSKDRTRRTGLSSWCKSCRTVSTRGWTNKNTQRLKSYRALKYEQNYDYMKARDYSLKQRYGIDLNGYDLLLRSQNYCCAICGRDGREMTYLLHVDHNHISGKVRGLLCAPCNVFLGHLKDDATKIERAIKYLIEQE